MKALEEKTQEPATMERANIWFPKTEQIAKFSTEAFIYIERLKKLEGINSEKAKELYMVLKKYREDILNVDSSIRLEFENNIPIISKSFDSTTKSGNEFAKKFFNNSSLAFTSAILTKFQNDIKVAENKTIAFCHNRIGSTDGEGFFDETSTIVGQSSTIVKPGDELKIMAGVGAFSRVAMPKVNINGRTVEIGEEGFALYKLRGPQKPGKYSVPVKIDYFNQTIGKQESKLITIEYTVAKECN
jgi:hypothetical protein